LHYNQGMTLLLLTKFYPQPVPDGFVTRPRLFGQLNQALTHRLTLVSAPAGAGKTTLISAWARSLHKHGHAFGWLSLDDGDNVPERFLEYLAACLEDGGAKLDMGPVSSSSSQAALVETFLSDIIQGLMGLKQEFVLILDDYHLIQNQVVHTALRYFLEHIPPHLHIILLTRYDPPLELARLRVTGQLAELRMEHLRFSTPEAAAFLLKSAGVQLTDSDIATLNARTDGWIAGLQMAAISLRGRVDKSAFVAAFAGSQRIIFDYLFEEVLNRQPPEVREFLLCTSVLDQLSVPLCDAVTEMNGGAARLLDILERSNLFLTPLNDERSLYRYHHLFADLLRLVLERTHPGLTVELHRRACCWFEAQDMIPLALSHALAANDMELAARLVSANVLALVEHNDLAPILMRMDAVPRKQRELLPWLGVAHAWALAYAGQMEQAGILLSLTRKHLEALPADERCRMMGHIAAVQAYVVWVHGSQQQAVDFSTEAESLLPAEEIAVRTLNLTTLGNALTQYGSNPDALEVLEQALALARQADESHVFMLAATALAYACFQLGRLHKAHEICLEAIQAADAYQRCKGQVLAAAASAYAEQAIILGEWGETEKSLQAARTGLTLSEQWGQVDAKVFCLSNLANVLSLAHEEVSAKQVIQRARQIAQKVSPWFVLSVDLFELIIYLDAADTAQAVHLAVVLGARIPATLEARLLLQQDRFDEVLALVEKALPEALENSSLEAARLIVLQSLAFYFKKDECRALSALQQALALAEPENMVATFVRQGPAMKKLLQLALTKSKWSAPALPSFVRRLLEASEAQPHPGSVLFAQTLVEPLSGREMEILRFLNGPLSAPEIARALTVSPHTVRTHIKNICGKLGAHGRSAAIWRAHELGLLK